MELFKKSVIVGVSVTPEVGLEVAQIDFASKTVLKYGLRPLEYDINRREIADLDIFKEALQDLFVELQIPKGAEIVLNIPSVTFKVKDYPASLDENQISNAIEEELLEHYIFKNTDPCISATMLPNASIQFKKVAYTAAQKSMIIEIAIMIKELGYKLYAIDTSVNSTLNSLIYKERLDVEPGKSWVLAIVDNCTCRVLLMNGPNYVDAYEDRISIGEVLGDAENYATVINALQPTLKNIPSQYLCIVSKTNVISAEVLASKIQYGAPIIHQEANSYSKEAFLRLGPGVDPELAQIVSLDIIGAAILKSFESYSSAHFNLFNSSLGDIYTSEQPPEITFGGRRIVFSSDKLFALGILLVVALIIPTVIALFSLDATYKGFENQKAEWEHKIMEANNFLKQNENISSDLFDEGDEIKMGLEHNKNIYSYYTIVGTEIPKKLWLTSLKLSDKVTIEGQADNLESVYSFFRSIKDYDPNSAIKLQKLGLSTNSKVSEITELSGENGEEFDTDSILTSLNADFYEFVISDSPVQNQAAGAKQGNNTQQSGNSNGLPPLEPIQ